MTNSNAILSTIDKQPKAASKDEMDILTHLKELGFEPALIDALERHYQLKNLSLSAPKGSEAESKGLKVGDTVRFQNDYGINFYGSRIYAFLNVVHTGQEERIIFLDNDSWWFPSITDQIRKHTKADNVIHAAIEASRHASNARSFDKEVELRTLAYLLEKKEIQIDEVKSALVQYDAENKTCFAPN